MPIKQHRFPEMTQLVHILDQTYQEIVEHANHQFTTIHTRNKKCFTLIPQRPMSTLSHNIYKVCESETNPEKRSPVIYYTK